MQTRIILLPLLLLMCDLAVSQQTPPKHTTLTGPYLGQKPPGMTAELFAPGVVSTGNFEHSSPVFTPDLTEIYWSTILEENGDVVSRPTYYMKMVNGVWSEPQIPAFGKKFLACENPFIVPDGKRLYFHVSFTIPINDLDIYYVDRVGEGWSDPIRMAAPINTPNRFECGVTVSKTGTLYFEGPIKDTGEATAMVCSRLVDGTYQKPAVMKGTYDGHYTDWTPYIAPDESYFIFGSFRDGGFGSGDLYICYKEKDGSWGKAINMGDGINTEMNERFPNVTPDGKYLFFNSTKKIKGADPNGPGNGYGDIYWIDARIIDELRPK